MNISPEVVKELFISGVPVSELFQGVEMIEPGIVGFTRKVFAKSPNDKEIVSMQRGKLLIGQNKEKNRPLSNREILQEIGGGPLQKNEWLQINELPNTGELLITGTRGTFRLKRQFKT